MTINQEKLNQYARLIVRTGANVQPDQIVRLQIAVDQAELAEQIVKECYAVGAKYVELFWDCDSIQRLHYLNASAETLGTVRPWEEARAKQMVDDLPVRIFVVSEDPDALAGVSPDLLSTVSQMRSKVLKTYRDQIDGKHQWCIAAAASPKWAEKVFPNEDTQTAVSKLWDAIFSCVYLDKDEDPVALWAAHNLKMKEKAAWLNEQSFGSLHYQSANGTDFTVGLIPGAKWCGACDCNHLNGAEYTPNMPTEEVFTSPMAGKAEGRLVSTKPLSWNGQLIEDFTVDYRDGRAVSCSARVGEEILTKMFHMDDGAAMLGEVALVPKESPINQSGLLFSNTLFDENACCHVAAGRGFGEVFEGFLDMTMDEMKSKGLNDSLIHVDYMIGSEDLSIVGIKADGTQVPVFVNGTWAD